MCENCSKDFIKNNRCHADSDGDCYWELCPQIRDNEPETTGRSCPLWLEHKKEDEDE